MHRHVEPLWICVNRVYRKRVWSVPLDPGNICHVSENLRFSKAETLLGTMKTFDQDELRDYNL